MSPDKTASPDKIDQTVENVYRLQRPEGFLPLVFDSPHSGQTYPADFKFACDAAMLARAEDKYVEELFADAPAHGAALLEAYFPRSYIDTNRCEMDIDYELLGDEWPHESNGNGRSHAGIGLIRRLAKPGVPIYNRTLTSAEFIHRLTHYYRPYHAALERLLDDAHYRYGTVYHINCHSMPAPAMAQAFAYMNAFSPPDFVLGDRDGTTCDPAFTRAVRKFLEGKSYKVAVNDPYKGVELVRRYADPARGRHSIQIEIGKWLYMDEQSGRKTRKFGGLKKDIDDLIGFIADYVRAQQLPIAAD